MEVFDDEYPLTSDQLTCAQINQLKNAWHLSNAELLQYKALVHELTQKNEFLLNSLNNSNADLELESTKSILSSICSNHPDEPVTLIKELAKLLPIVNHHQFILTAIIKTGESWVGISSNSVCHETINFKSRLFDEMLKFRLKSKSKVTIETLASVLPLPVVNYIYCGTVPARESYYDLFNDDSQCPVVSLPFDDIYLRQSLPANVTIDSLFKQTIVLRSQHMLDIDSIQYEEIENNPIATDRVVWLLSLAHKSNPTTDVYIENISFQKIAVNVFGADTSIYRGDNGYFMSGEYDQTDTLHNSSNDNDSNIESATAFYSPDLTKSTGKRITNTENSSIYWQLVFKYTQQLVLTTLLHSFETKKSELKVLESAALMFFDNLLRDKSHGSEFLKDVYSDEIWQEIPIELEDFINTYIINMLYPTSNDEGNDNNDHSDLLKIENINKTCHCELFVTSNFGINELNKGGLSEIPLISSKRNIHMLYLNDKEHHHESILNDGHTAALNSVLYKALVSDAISVQSYSEISFQERNPHSLNSSNEYKSRRVYSGTEQTPLVQFHTLIAVPLLLSESTNKQLDETEDSLPYMLHQQQQEVKGCVLIHICSSIVPSSLTPHHRDRGIGGSSVSSGGGNTLSGYMNNQSHPVYTAPAFATSNTHSSIMNQISSNYYLLEAGRQPMIESVVSVTKAISSLILKFLIKSNCHPISLFPIKSFVSHIQKRFEMIEENNVGTSDLDLIANGLYSILSSQDTLDNESVLFKSFQPYLNISQFPKNKQAVNNNFHKKEEPGVHLSLVTHLKQMLHSDWVLICALTPSSSSVVHFIDNAGVDCYVKEPDLPMNWRRFIIPALQKKVQSNQVDNNRKLSSTVSVAALPNMNELDISEILSLLHFEQHHKHSLHTICDSSSSSYMHHAYGICLSSSDHMEGFYSEHMTHDNYEKKKNIVILTGRFFRGPYDKYSHSLDELRSSFQTAVSHRDLILSQKALLYLTSQKHYIQQEVICTNKLEENLKYLHQTTLGSTKSNMSSLVAFRKGLLKVLVEFFRSLHRLHFNSAATSVTGIFHELQVLGIELVVYESTGLEEGRRRAWSLDPNSADWIKVHANNNSNKPSSALSGDIPSHSRKNTTSPNRQAAFHTVVDVLTSVYEEKGSSVLYVHKKQNHYKENKYFSKIEDEDEDPDFDDLKLDDDLIGMQAAIYIHYETPKSQESNKFFSSLQSSPTSMRILKNFIGLNAQALFQPLYPIYTPIKQYLTEHPSIDEEQQWEDNALLAQASNIAIKSLTRAIMQNSLKENETDSEMNDGSSKNLLHKQPHYRYLYQKQLLRKLMEIPPFSAFMLIPIREVTFAEMSLLTDDLSNDSGSSDEGEAYGRAEEDVRYVHLLPTTTTSMNSSSHNHIHDENVNIFANHLHHKKKTHSNAHSLLASMLPNKLNKSIQTAVAGARTEQDSSKKRTQHHTERASRLIVLEGGTGDILHTYLGEIHDKQQRKRQHHNSTFGGAAHSLDEYDLYGYVDVSSVRSNINAFDRRGNNKRNEVALVNPRSLVLLYSPLSSNHKHADDDEDYGVLQSDSKASLNHYYLIVCRSDRMIVPSVLARLQSCLDEIFMPWRVLAASQPWFECMTGIEQLVRASSNNLPTQTITKIDNSLNLSFSSPIINVFEQGQNILYETIASMRRVLGNRCIGAVGYQINQNKDSTVSDSNAEIDLIRCCSDNGVVTCAKTGRIANMLQGPAKLHSLSTIDLLFARYNSEQHTGMKPKEISKRGQMDDSKSKHSSYTAYYVEMSSGEHIRQLDKEFTWSKKKSHKTATHHADTSVSESESNVHVVQEILSASHIFLRSDIRVMQIYLTAAGSNTNHDDTSTATSAPLVENKSIVASILLYISMASQDDVIDIETISTDPADANHPIYPSICHIERDDFHKNTFQVTGPSQNYFLTLGMLNCIMRVGDTAGLLLASLYRQQYDCYQNALQSYNHRKQMHLHAHKLGETLARINHEVKLSMNIQNSDGILAHENHSAVLADNRSLASSPSRVSKHSHHTGSSNHIHKNEQYLSDAQEQKEFAELALESAQVLIQQYQQLKDLYANEQQTLSNVRMKYHEVSQDNRIKAAKFRAYFDAVRSAIAIMNTSTSDSDDESLNSINSGVEKVAEVQASIPDVLSLHASIASIVSNTQTLRKALETIAELAAHEEISSKYFNNLLRSLSDRCSSFEVNKDDQSILSMDSQNLQEVEACNNYRNVLSLLRNTPFELEASVSDIIVPQNQKPTSEKTKFKDGYGGYERDFHNAPDANASIWWVVEPGSHLSVINLANSNTTKESCLDLNTLYSKEKFIEALNSKNMVLIEGEELLQLLPHVVAFYSSRGYIGYGNDNFCNIQLIYQPILASLHDDKNNNTKEPTEYSYYSSEASSHEEEIPPSEKVVVAIVQYIIVRDTRISNGNAGDYLDSLDGSRVMEQEVIDNNAEFSLNKLASVLRQSFIVQIEQIMSYMGQHMILRSNVLESSRVGPVSVTPSLNSSRTHRSKNTSEISLLHSFKQKISIDDHLMGGTPYMALVSALDFILNPSALSLTTTLAEQAKENETMRVMDHWKGMKRSSGGSIASESRSSRSSHQSSHSSEHSRTSQSIERAVITASLHPISAWVGQLLAGLLRADSASMLHLSHSNKKSKSTDRDGLHTTSTSAVYEGIRFRYNHGAVSCLESHENHPPSPHMLRMRPSNWLPLQSLLEKYTQHYRNVQSMKSTEVFITYQESVLNHKKRSVDIVYSSKSVTSIASAVSLVDDSNSSNVKQKYILAAGISNRNHLLHDNAPSSAMKGSVGSSRTNHVSFGSKSNSSSNNSIQHHSKENHHDQRECEELIVAELSHRPTTADLKAFSSITQLVQLYVWSQHQREHIKLKESELATISSSLANTSQLLVDQKDQNQLYYFLTNVMEQFKRYVFANQIDGYRAVYGISTGTGALEIEDVIQQIESNRSSISKVEHVLEAINSSHDHLCQAIGKSEQVLLISLPRIAMKELREILSKAETISTRSRGSLWEEDSGLTGRLDLGLHIEPISKHLPKRFLQTLLSEQPPVMQYGFGQHSSSAAAAYMMKHHPQLAQLANNSSSMKESPLKVATRLFGALCIHFNIALICDIFDCIDVNNLDTSSNFIPELARSIMVPLLDQSADQILGSIDPSHNITESNYDNIIDTHLKSLITNIINRSSNTSTISMQQQQQHYHHPDSVKVVSLIDISSSSSNVQKQDKDTSSSSSSTKVLNNTHAWFLQLVFPTIEARDEYASVVINSDKKNNSAIANNTNTSLSSSPVDSNKNNSSKEMINNLLQYSFLNNFTDCIKQNVQQSRLSTKNALSLLQIHLDEAIQTRISACMDQILLMSIPSNTVRAKFATSSEENEILLDDDINSLHSLEFRIDQIAASFAHVSEYISSHLVPNKLSYLTSSSSNPPLLSRYDENDDSELLIIDESDEASPLSFEVSISDTRLHWMNINTSVGISSSDNNHMNEQYSNSSSIRDNHYDVGDWLTVELATLNASDLVAVDITSENVNGGSFYNSINNNESSMKMKKVDLSKELDSLLYHRCKYKQWDIIPSLLSKKQVNDLLNNVHSTSETSPSSSGMSISLVDANQFMSHKKIKSRSNSNNTEIQYSSLKPSYEKSQEINAFIRSDGSIELQLLIVVKGSEQPAIMEIRLVCLLTSTKNAMIECRRNGMSRSKAIFEQDELALVEMIEQVIGMVLKPTIPTLKLVRSSLAHLLEHCVAARACVRWEYEWDAYLLHAQQRISLLCNAITLLTSEGYKASTLIKLIQEIFCRIPSLQASHIICKDNTNNQVIYDYTMSYTEQKDSTNNSTSEQSNSNNHNNTTSVSGVLATPLTGATTAIGSTSTGAGGVVSKSLFSATTQSHSKMVSFINLCNTPSSNNNNNKQTVEDHQSEDPSISFMKNKNNMDQIIDSKSLQDLDQFEIIFDCYEVHGKLTIYFKYPANASNIPMSSTSSATTTATENAYIDVLNDIINPSPYYPISSPSKMRKTQNNIQTTSKKSSSPINKNNKRNRYDNKRKGIDPNIDTSDNESTSNNNHNQQDQLISLKSLFENITRAMARRVFELHRGHKNKKLMASKQHELIQKNNQLLQQEEILQNLEFSNTMSRQELQDAASESERLRLLMASEQRNLKESIKQKKEMNSHLRQSLLELRRESDTQNLIHKKQTQSLKDKILGLEMMNDRTRKDMEKLKTKEIICDNSNSTLNIQIKELQGMLKTAESTVRQLRNELQTSSKELSILQTKEHMKLTNDDVKMSGLLTKINKIDQDLQYARGTNEKLVKQLNACKLTMKLNQEDAQRQINHLQNKLNNRTSSSSGGSPLRGNTSSTGGGGTGGRGTSGNSPLRTREYDIISNKDKLLPYEELKQKLQYEEKHTMDLQKQINDMEKERKTLVDGWQDIKSKSTL